MELTKLKDPFPADLVEWRIGSTNKDKTKGMALAYIDARMVQDRLDDVCGIGGWQCRYPHAGVKTVCEIGVKIGDEWVWKSDGAGDTDFEAEKGGLSDAFKRAAVKWGIGRYLYDMPAPWVSIDEFKKIQPSEMERLRSMLPNAKDTLKVGMSGLSKTPAKFWDGASLMLALPQSLLNAGDMEQIDWFYEKLEAGIMKAPDRDKLAKFQTDNQHIINMMDDLSKEKIIENFMIRAEQFDEMKGK